MDATLLTILFVLVFATVIALLQARRRDPCLVSFDEFNITLAETGGDLVWGQATVYPTGIELTYHAPILTRSGFREASFLLYKEQYSAVNALYRYPEGLSPEAKERRAAIIRRTANPSLWLRFKRTLRNWIGLVRDALVQAVGIVIGAVKTQRPGSVVLSSQEAQMKALSSEVIGHAGNAYDPMLENHLFKPVVLELTRDGQTLSYCGWLKNYTSTFLEVVDAVTNTGPVLSMAAFYLHETPLPNVALRLEDGVLYIENHSEAMLFLSRAEAGSWERPLNTVLPPRYAADLAVPYDTDPATVQVSLGTTDRVDIVVPRTHALIRHAAASTDLVPLPEPEVAPRRDRS